jgi:hypothetical protein
MTFDYLLTTQRSTRLVDQNPDDVQGDGALPSLRTVLRETTESVRCLICHRFLSSDY